MRYLLAAVAAIAMCLAFGSAKEAKAQGYGQVGFNASGASGAFGFQGTPQKVKWGRRGRRRGGQQPQPVMVMAPGPSVMPPTDCPPCSTARGDSKFEEYLRFVIYHKMIHDQDDRNDVVTTEQIIRDRINDAAKQAIINKLIAQAAKRQEDNENNEQQLIETLRGQLNAAVIQGIIESKRAQAPSIQPMPAQPQVMLLPSEPQQAQVHYRAQYVKPRYVRAVPLVPLRRVR